ncbi:MAG TPA: trypsin-like peptidase domain-containing protein, partial [Isosphaeraceae bacterium]
PDPIRPWQKGSTHEASGSGMVIEGKRVLTNAHVVLYASQVFVQPNGSGEKIAATVEGIAPGIDLALLKLEDEAFFDKRPPLPRTEGLPEIKEAVLVYGYPTGGTSLSLTKGIVSRIEFVPYNSGTHGLRIQVDAPINPGNSGGPALVNDKVIGLAFSRLGGGDNIGYIIPSEEIDLFLKDVADGKYEGKPALMDGLATFENDVLKGKLNMKRAVGMIVHDPARDDKVIGLAFSRLGGGDNIGYIIPSEEIDLFMKDVADGKYDGKPSLMDGLATFENDALKGKLNMKRAVGMIVHDLPREDDKDYPLKEWDVVVKIGDKEIDNVGMVPIRDNLRVKFQYLVQKFANDGKVALTIVRDGKEQVVQVPVAPRHDELIQPLMGKYPDYFIYGPMVFSTATAEFLSNLERIGAQYFSMFSYIGSPLVTRRGDKAKFPGEELVVVSSPMFPHKTAKGYSNPIAKVVKSVNGTRIKNIRHLVETLRDSKDKYIVVEFDDRASEAIVFDRKEVLQATEEILSDNSVRQQFSEDLAPIWSKKP